MASFRPSPRGLSSSERTEESAAARGFARLVVVALAAASLTASCGTPDEPPTGPRGAAKVAGASGATNADPSDDEGEDETDGQETEPCKTGETRECKVKLGSHNGVSSCYVGVETCADGTWGSCGDGKVTTLPEEGAGGAGEGSKGHGDEGAPEHQLMSLSDAEPCANNPCDPTCQAYVEKPPAGIALPPGAPAFDWEVGNLSGFPAGLVSKGLQEPCSVASDCQFDHRCESPAKMSCGHSPCVPGDALSPSCSPCVSAVCDADPTCCEYTYSGSCAHDPCTTGKKLKATCDPCVAEICKVDKSCCKDQWKASCVDKVATLCGKTCGGATAWTDACVDKVYSACGAYCEVDPGCVHDKCYAGGPLSPTCDPCVAAICQKDPYCCQADGAWDAYCVSEVSDVCGGHCKPQGQCAPWLPGEKDPGCTGVDLTLGPPCDQTLVVCNRGSQTAPAGVKIVHFPANSQQYPKCDPDLSHPQANTCTTAEPVPPGECINVSGCAGLTGNRELMVNPSGQGQVAECSCANNWSLYSSGAACEAPSCSGASSSASLKKVNIFVTIDKSGSMSWNGWSECMSALKAFIQDTKSAGLGLSLRFWPDGAPVAGCDGNTCSVNACSQALVPLGTLTDKAAPVDAHEDALLDAIESRSPGGNTPMYPALGGAAAWAQSYQLAHPDEETVVLLITDGEPTACNTSVPAIAKLASDAFDGSGVRTYVIGIEAGTIQDTLDAIAEAGGTQKAYLVPKGSGGNVNAQLLAALEEIRGTPAACDFPLPNEGLFDPGNVDVVYTPGSGSATALEQVFYPSDCGEGWYYDDYANPTKITLCPATCDTVKADGAAQLGIEIGCPSMYQALTQTQLYQGTCPPGTAVQWGYFAYDTGTPSDSRVVFRARTANDPSMADAGAFATLATASQTDGQSCLMGGPEPCPVDLYEELGLPSANRAYLELQMTLDPSTGKTAAPVVKSWNVTYSCPAAE